MPQTSSSRKLICLAALLSSAFIMGCSQNPVVVEKEGDGYSTLMALETAYRQYVAKKRKPPSSKDDLKPFGMTDDSFLSPRDGKPLKIYWGTSLVETDFDNPTIIAHELDGIRGKKLVLSRVGVMMLTDKEFDVARFPPSN